MSPTHLLRDGEIVCGAPQFGTPDEPVTVTPYAERVTCEPCQSAYTYEPPPVDLQEGLDYLTDRGGRVEFLYRPDGGLTSAGHRFRAERMAGQSSASGLHPDPELCDCGGSGYTPGVPEDEPCPWHAEEEDESP